MKKKSICLQEFSQLKIILSLDLQFNFLELYCSSCTWVGFLELKCQLNQASWGVNLGIGTKSSCTLGLGIPLNIRWLILELGNFRRGLNLVERLTSLKNSCVLSTFIFLYLYLDYLRFNSPNRTNISNTPSTFTCLMNEVLRPFTGKFCGGILLWYLDI